MPPTEAALVDLGDPAHADQPLARQIAAVLRIRAFRRLWITLALSSVGDWLGLLATAVIASKEVTGSTAKGAAFGAVVVVRLLPALVLAPLAGAFADRFDRRVTMVVCDVLRFALFASIPVLGSITWTLAASFLIEMVGMFWVPAKEASVPNLVKKERLEAANQLSLFTTYGLTPVVGALIFAALAGITRVLGAKLPYHYFDTNRVDLSLYFNALTFLVAAVVVLLIPEISGHRPADAAARPPSLLHEIREGWSFVRTSTLVRGLVIGILGALAAGGVVIGTGRFYAESLGGGDAAFGLLFGCLFIGLGGGMGLGPKMARQLSRRRWFGMSIVLAGVSVALLCVTPFLAVAMVLVLLVGGGAGMAYLAGVTLLGAEVDDDLRGRTFGFVQAMLRVVLMLSTAVSSVLVGLGGRHTIWIGPVSYTFNGSRGLLLIGGLLAIGVGVAAFRHMDDKPGVAVLPDLIASLRGHPLPVPDRSRGVFVAFEGGEGVGKSTQLRLLAGWLAQAGYEPVVTQEPGATPMGARVRQLLLDPASRLSPRAEALLYAADRADHVATVIRPALERGAVVLTDRYVDSSLAYQGAGRDLPVSEVARLSEWATGGLRPDVVVLLDLDPRVGLERAGRRSSADRLEAESVQFHERVRAGFLALAEGDRRYLILDAAADAGTVATAVRERVAALLPPPPQRGSNATAPAEPAEAPASPRASR